MEENKIFVIVTNDRHYDIGIELWTDKEKAISQAKLLAQDLCKHKEDYKESFSFTELCIIHINYSCEGDHIYVTERKINS